jgi:hypothetical protein
VFFKNLASKWVLNCRLWTHYTGYGSRISCLNLTLLHEWCDLNRLSNAYFDAKFQKNTFMLDTVEGEKTGDGISYASHVKNPNPLKARATTFYDPVHNALDKE